mmetsp:Transcript_11984/g.41347  ORF Transcript_11984/g.41347 Transcript_11984/m.41347 type:complete len:114 (-) Transcript_11984:1072-1413(-)
MANPHVNDLNLSQLEEELVKCKSDLKKAFSEGVMTGVSSSLLPPASHLLHPGCCPDCVSDSKQKEFTKLSADKERLSKEMEACKADLDTLRKMLKVKVDEKGFVGSASLAAGR